MADWIMSHLCTCNHQLQPHDRMSICPEPKDPPEKLVFGTHPQAACPPCDDEWLDIGGEA